MGAEIYSLMISLTACFFFFCLAGFNIELNFETLLFSMILSVIYFSLQLIEVILPRFTTVSNLAVSLSGLKITALSIIGFLFLHEQVTITSATRIVLILIALLFMSSPRNNDSLPKKQNNLNKYIFIILSVSFSCAATLIVRKYTRLYDTINLNSLFFLANIFIVFLSVIRILTKRNFDSKNEFKVIGRLNYYEIIIIIVIAICSNILSLLEGVALKTYDISIYQPIVMAIGFIASAMTSFLIREKVGIKGYVAVAISVISAFV